MSYPAAPSHRFPYHTDGTLVVELNQSTFTELASATVIRLNGDIGTNSGEIMATNTGGPLWVGLVFPELRDITHVYYKEWLFSGVLASDTSARKIWTSADTTNGQDGTWAEAQTITMAVTNQSNNSAVPFWRNNLLALSPAPAGVRGIRIGGLVWLHDSVFGSRQVEIGTIHVWGNYSSDALHRLAVWKPTTNFRIAQSDLDFGDVDRNTTATKTFRIKNLSSTYAANTITVALSIPTDYTPSVPGGYALSSDGTTFTTTLSLGNLAPGAFSPVLYVRRTTPSNGHPGLHTPVLSASAASWV